MKEVTIMKNGKHWSIYDANSGEMLYTGKSRVECFREVRIRNMKITAYQHGGYSSAAEVLK